MKMTAELLWAWLLGYLLGSIPFGLLLTRMAGKGDVRDVGLGALAVGEAGVVGDVDDRRVEKQRSCRPEHRQPADPGVEEQKWRGGIHGATVWRGH